MVGLRRAAAVPEAFWLRGGYCRQCLLEVLSLLILGFAENRPGYPHVSHPASSISVFPLLVSMGGCGDRGLAWAAHGLEAGAGGVGGGWLTRSQRDEVAIARIFLAATKES
jgi:hypothetical protein